MQINGPTSLNTPGFSHPCHNRYEAFTDQNSLVSHADSVTDRVETNKNPNIDYGQKPQCDRCENTNRMKYHTTKIDEIPNTYSESETDLFCGIYVTKYSLMKKS